MLLCQGHHVETAGGEPTVNTSAVTTVLGPLVIVTQDLVKVQIIHHAVVSLFTCLCSSHNCLFHPRLALAPETFRGKMTEI